MAQQTEEQQAIIDRELEAAGVSTEDQVFDDYFGFEESHKVTLPDGVSYVEYKVMNEGERRHYLNNTNRDVRIARQTGDAHMSMKPGDERHALMLETITGWNLREKGGKEVPFTEPNLQRFLDKANPRVIDLIEKEIRKSHPWLMADMTLEDIDKEIENLQEMRELKLKEEQGNVSSASR